MKFALSLPGPSPGGYRIDAPGNAPSGGLSTTGASTIQVAINLLLLASIIVFLLVFLWAAINWITSEGEKQKLQNARNKIVFAIVGLVVVLSAFLIINFIGSFLSVKLIGL